MRSKTGRYCGLKQKSDKNNPDVAYCFKLKYFHPMIDPNSKIIESCPLSNVMMVSGEANNKKKM
jgi:hypothetical protein